MYKKYFRLRDGDKNFGIIYSPSKNIKNIPVIIYCHGWGSRGIKNSVLFDTQKHVRDLAIENNMAFVTFDNYDYGLTRGTSCEFSYGRWAECLNSVYEYLVLNGFQASKIGCYAISSGTTAAFRMEQKYNKLSFIVSVATAISNNIVVKGGPIKVYNDNMDLLESGGIIEFAYKKVSIVFFSDTVNNTCIDSMYKVKCPVLFLQGGSDNSRRIQDSIDGYEYLKAQGKQCEYHIIEGGNHGLSNRKKECADGVINFLSNLFCT